MGGQDSIKKAESTTVAVEPLSIDDEAAMPNQSEGTLNNISRSIRTWTPAAFLVSYFVFSISLYVLVDEYSTKVFWFLYLTIATLLAGTTTLEAYDGLTFLREARKAKANLEKNEWKFKSAEDDLPHVELLFDDIASKGSNWDRVGESLRAGICYPSEKLHVTVISRHPNHQIAIDEKENFRRIWIPQEFASSAARFRIALKSSETSTDSSIAVLLSGKDRLHPHSLRFAVDRLVQNAKIHVVQGRNVFAPQQVSSLASSLSSLQHDFEQALIQPGRSSTWVLGIASGYGSFWRTSSLHDAVEAVDVSMKPLATASDLAYAAYANGSKSVHDLSVVVYSSPPTTIKQYLSYQSHGAMQQVRDTAEWTRLAFSKAIKGRPETARAFKSRVGVMYDLPTQVLAVHTITQLLSWALAMLFTRTPVSGPELAERLYWSSPVSQWLVIVGTVCLVSTVGMAYGARSESISPTTLLLGLVLYPLVMALWAITAVYGQVEAML